MIPALPAFFDMQFTDSKGKLSKDGYLYEDQSFQVLNVVVSLLNAALLSEVNGNTYTLDGIALPSKTTAQIGVLQPTAQSGTMWFNSDLKKLQFKSDTGVIETITSA